jgi:hypothetical protein
MQAGLGHVDRAADADHARGRAPQPVQAHAAAGDDGRVRLGPVDALVSVTASVARVRAISVGQTARILATISQAGRPERGGPVAEVRPHWFVNTSDETLPCRWNSTGSLKPR